VWGVSRSEPVDASRQPITGTARARRTEGTPGVDLQPEDLTRGAAIAVPHIEVGDFVDGSRRVELPGTVARVIGQVDDGWLVGTTNVGRKRNRRDPVKVEAP
jgi:hypothetical protein